MGSPEDARAAAGQDTRATASVAQAEPPSPKMPWRAARMLCSRGARCTLLAVMIAVAGVAALRNGVPTLASVQDQVGEFGLWAPLVFLVLYALGVISLFPVSILTAASGLLFGVPVGVGVVWLGAMLGAGGSYALAGSLASASRRALLGRRGMRLSRILDQHGMAAMVAVRLVPILPLGLVNYAALAASLRPAPYFLGTGLGILPVTVLLVLGGGSITAPGWPVMVGTCALGATALLVLAVVAFRWRNGARSDSKPTSVRGGVC